MNFENTVIIPASSPLCIFRPEFLKELFAFLGQLDDGDFNIFERRNNDDEFECVFRYPSSLMNSAGATQFYLMVEEALRTKTFQEITKCVDQYGLAGDGSPLAPHPEINQLIMQLMRIYGTQVSVNVEPNPDPTNAEMNWDWYLTVSFNFEGIGDIELTVVREHSRLFVIVPEGYDLYETNQEKTLERFTMEEALVAISKQVISDKIQACPIVGRLIMLFKDNNVEIHSVHNEPGRTFTIHLQDIPVSIDFDARTGPNTPSGAFTLIQNSEDGREAIRDTQSIQEVLDWVVEQSSRLQGGSND